MHDPRQLASGEPADASCNDGAVHIEITDEDPASAEATALIEALSWDLADRYDSDGPERAGFDPAAQSGPGRTFVVARLDDVPVGCAALVPVKPTVGELKRMYVVPEARGRGVARALLQAIEDAARRNGYRELWLETGMRQPEAIALYESAGYERIADFGHYAGEELVRSFGKRL